HIPPRQVQHHDDTGREGLQEPGGGNRGRQFNVTHALTTHFGLSNFNAALLTDDTAVLQTLVLTAQALIVLDRTKDARAEQTVTLRLEGTVVDGLRLFDFTERPGTDHFWRGEADADGVKLVSVVLVTQKID